ncbi:cytochrome P450 [Mycobacterium sp. 852002-50816_SCH5313054-b]|uniref:cytochrome P450 n=1 Tax=Mycobacterium sp. 852002-50816_SCH5313054-b TaxID=1834092 RepID=UPI0007FF6991|nr:cytochrome P450 [Mycobacterium sp. 852002-50816_SCH5313054-b]OBF54774.1 cytochrome P450 [Mycobacterium sp. 852002-50816_SCH5313054-b]
MGAATTDPVRLPRGPRIPKVVQGVVFATARERTERTLARRYGRAFTLNMPIFGKTVVISDPAQIKDLFTMSADLVGGATLLGAVFGPGSTFSLDGDEHRKRRKLVVPAFHGKRMQCYESLIEHEVMRETATWPEGTEFETLPSMMRITLNALLRAVFGAEGAALDELRGLLPPWVALGSRIAVLPSIARRDFGPWSPGGCHRAYRKRYDAIIDSLIRDALTDSAFEQRNDVLSLMLRARYEDGSPIPKQHIADELLTLLAAGYETTATTLAWAVERLRRHPRLLARLAEEVDAGGSELRQATIWEVQRTRSVIDGVFRVTKQRIRLGEWVIPEQHTVIASIGLAHSCEENFPDANTFNPDRFIGNAPQNYMWIPFGGGVRRCIGAAFANMQMTVVLRTLLREFEFDTTSATDEPHDTRGVSGAPALGAQAVVHARRARRRNEPFTAQAQREPEWVAASV